MKRKIVLGILIVAALFLLGALVAEYYLEKVFDVKLLVSFLGAVAAIVKLSDVGGSSCRCYEAEYRHILRTAFSEPKKRRSLKKLLKAIELYDRDRTREALLRLDRLRNVCETADEHAAVLIFSALCLSELGLADDAIATYREVCRYDAGRSTVWSNMGLLLEKKGEREGAIACYENALTYDMTNPYAHNNLASVYYRMGDYPSAIRFAERALGFKSNMPEAFGVLCLSYCAEGEHEKAEEYYKLAVCNGANAEGLRRAMTDLRRNME